MFACIMRRYCMNDLSVALIFFNRPNELEKVFAQVAKAKPGKLFLIQDGPRNEDDLRKIQECRKIVDTVSWDCEVYRNYSETNLGCGKRPESGISWAFQYTDKLIILEDDCFPAMSFFQFCDELLNKYKDDYRIGLIAGTNYFGEYDFGGFSYGFVKTGSIWGWATWRSRWEKNSYLAQSIEDEYVRECLLYDVSTHKRFSKMRVRTWENANDELKHSKKVSYWDYQWGLARHVNSFLAIVPHKNLVKNIGFNMNATHESNLYLLPKEVRNTMCNEIHEIVVDRHPEYVLPNRKYDIEYYNVIYPHFLRRYWNKFIKACKIMLLHLKGKNND